MKTFFKTITISLISTLFWGDFCFANIINTNDKNTQILYDQKVGNLTNEQIDKLWPSNTSRSWVLTGIMDGEIVKKYKAWSNKYKSQVKGTNDERSLDDNTDLTVYLKNLN